MEGAEVPVSDPKPDKQAQKKPEPFPKYSSIDRGLQKDSFLTGEELVVQTDRFMQRFEELIKKTRTPRYNLLFR